MSININNLTDREKYFLLKLSYLDLNTKIDYSRSNSPSTIETVLKAAKIANKNNEKSDYIDVLLKEYNELSFNSSKLKDIRIVAYENHNPVGNTTHDDKTGFVGYALEDSDGNRGFLFRGSEMEDGLFGTDMLENTESRLIRAAKSI